MQRGSRVSLRGEEEIAQMATFVRENFARYITNGMLDVVKAVEHNIAIGFEVVDQDELGGLYGLSIPDKGVIKITNPIYEDAVNGDKFARHVMAHELGHFVMHNSGMSFASAAIGEIFRKEESSEWQADIFADYLLAPVEHIKSSSTAANLSATCGIPLSRAILLRQKSKYR